MGGGLGGGAGGTGGSSQVPLIGAVLTCGKLGSAGGLGPGTDMNRYDFDLGQFPDALCNDGTPALLYFRPASAQLNRNRWVIFLQGGGACDSPADCAARWCNAGTNFGMQGMSASPAPSGINANGILERRVDNPMGSWNHVLVKYCSSDSWSGTRKDLIVDAPDPLDGGARRFRMHALGARILDATLSRLQSDAGSTLSFMSTTGTMTPMPDLDDAETVILAGASGGGAGTIFNLDRVRALIRATNTACQGASCPLVFQGLIDSIFTPSLETLDYSTSTLCDAGVCSYLQHRNLIADAGNAAFWGQRSDESCVSWHQANAPASAAACNDTSHVLRNHLTAPFFVRQGQADSLLSKGVVEVGFTVPAQGVMTVPIYMSLIRSELRALANIKTTAEEGALISTVPGAFGPTCSKHETFTDTDQTFGVSIDAGVSHKLLTVATNWFLGNMPINVVAGSAADNVCPP